MKMLIFDFRDSERDFFNKNDFPDFEILQEYFLDKHRPQPT